MDYSDIISKLTEDEIDLLLSEYKKEATEDVSLEEETVAKVAGEEAEVALNETETPTETEAVEQAIDLNADEEEATTEVAESTEEDVTEKVAEAVSETPLVDKVEPLIDTLTEEIYSEMKKDATFGSALRVGMEGAKKAAPWLLGAAAAGGIAGGHVRQNRLQQSQQDLARMMAAETAADIATDQVFNKRDIAMHRNVVQNRAALLALADHMKKNQMGPEKVKKASLATMAAKGAKWLTAGKGHVTSAAKTVKGQWGAAFKGGKSKAATTAARRAVGTQVGFGAAGVGLASMGGKKKKED